MNYFSSFITNPFTLIITTLVVLAFVRFLPNKNKFWIILGVAHLILVGYSQFKSINKISKLEEANLEQKEKLLKAANYINVLEHKTAHTRENLEEVFEYINISKLALRGRELELSSGKQGPRSELHELMKKVYTYSFKTDKYNLNKNIEKAEMYAKKAIVHTPAFPFSYYALYQIYKEKNNDESLEYKSKAIKILKITTNIPGHSDKHDKVLEILTQSN